MEIGLFQLENLMISRSPFVFLDLRETREENLPPEIQRCLQNAHPVAADEAESYLKSQQISPDRPILLMDEEGERARQTARSLEAAGYSNVYIVAEGLAGLLSEL